MTDDVPSAYALLSLFRDTLMIDEEWSVLEENQLTWVASQLKQEVTVGEPFESRGVMLRRVTSEVELARDVPPLGSEELLDLGVNNSLAAGDAIVWLPDEGRIIRRLHGLVHSETVEWRIKQIATMAIIQLTMAERSAVETAEIFNGHPSERWVHPESGIRPERDDMLNLSDSFFYRSAHDPNSFASAEEFEAVAEMANSTGRVSFGASEGGVCVETGFGESDTALIHLRPEKHPAIGDGLLTSILIRPAGKMSARVLAAWLNLQEHTQQLELHGFGAWCVHVRDGQELLGHAFFTPAPMYSRGLIQDCYFGAIGRAEWADRVLTGEHEDDGERALRAIYDRLGLAWDGEMEWN